MPTFGKVGISGLADKVGVGRLDATGLFEPVGTHKDYRRRGFGRAIMLVWSAADGGRRDEIRYRCSFGG